MTDPMELVERVDPTSALSRDPLPPSILADALLQVQSETIVEVGERRIHAENLMAMAAACIRELVEWRPIETFDGCGQARPAIVAVPTKEGAWIVGEAWLRAEEEGATYDNGWWWAGTGPDDYHDSPIYEMSHHRGGPTHWLPLPSPPADRGGV